MILTPKQIEILKWLSRYKYVCVAQFHDHLFTGTTRRNAEIALQKLDKTGFIKRQRFPSLHSVNYGMVCSLTRKGAIHITGEMGLDARLVTGRFVGKPIRSVNHFYHRKRLVDFLIRLDASVSHQPNLQVKQLLTEYRQRPESQRGLIETTLIHGTDQITPDIVVVLQNTETLKEVAFCVEIDTATETIGGLSETVPAESVLAKFHAYERTLLSGSWRVVVDSSALAFQVLFVTESESRLKTVFARMVDTIERGEFFIGSTHDMVARKEVLTAPIWLKSLEVPLQPLLS